MEKTLDLLFATPVAKHQLEDTSICIELKNIILGDMTKYDELQLNEERHYTTNDQLHKDPRYAKLVDLINSTAYPFFDEVVGLDKSSLKLSSMWCNVSKRGHKHHIHQHPNSYFSGVFYVDVPHGLDKDAGNLFFVDPRPAKNMAYGDFTKESLMSSRTWWFEPKTGMFMFFPSWLEHGTDVGRFEESENRICIGFNYVLTKCSTETMSF